MIIKPIAVVAVFGLILEDDIFIVLQGNMGASLKIMELHLGLRNDHNKFQRLLIHYKLSLIFIIIIFLI